MSRAEKTSRVAPSQAGEAEPKPGDAMMSPPGNPVAARKTGDARTEPASVGPLPYPRGIELNSFPPFHFVRARRVSDPMLSLYLGRPESM